ncbi:MAG: hypothetical protein JRI65_14795 [Deltaproteobacteria bacterium]|nr:hypothetical protein [Deltaproteobacteria bacterium]
MAGYHNEHIIDISFRYIQDHPGCTTSDIFHHFIDDRFWERRKNKQFPTRQRISGVLKVDHRFKYTMVNREAVWYIARGMNL